MERILISKSILKIVFLAVLLISCSPSGKSNSPQEDTQNFKSLALSAPEFPEGWTPPAEDNQTGEDSNTPPDESLVDESQSSDSGIEAGDPDPGDDQQNSDSSNQDEEPDDSGGYVDTGDEEPPIDEDLEFYYACRFDGKFVTHGEQVVAYLSSTVEYGHSCEEVKELRNCHNGELSGSAMFTSCTVNGPKSCLFDGKTIAHGSKVLAYPESSVSFGKSCQAEERVCSDGVLLGEASFSSCQVAAPRSCLFLGETLAHGDQISAFRDSVAPFGQTCESEVRVCHDGVLSGTYGSRSCQVEKTGQLDYLWQFPASCGGFAGYGWGTHASRYSIDQGRTWVAVIGQDLPIELKGVWDYLVSKYPVGKCLRPTMPFTPPNADGYVSFDPQYLPRESQCGYKETPECVRCDRSGCLEYQYKHSYVCN